ncbi:MAG: YfiR family protein [Chitinophagaceae bacterium]
MNIKRTVLFSLLVASSGFAMGQSANKEADLKAVFIYNFTRYIDWDTTTLGKNFVIGVLGQSPITTSLNKIAASSTVANRKIIVQVYEVPENIRSCQILFIPSQSPHPLPVILNNTGNSVLTVSEEEGFARRGTAINFYILNNKLKFEINVTELAAKNLRASSQLLKLATIIQ